MPADSLIQFGRFFVARLTGMGRIWQLAANRGTDARETFSSPVSVRITGPALQRRGGIALAVSVLILLATGCATTPGPFTTVPADSPSLIQARASDRHLGARIRWGGRIAEVENKANYSLIEIVEQPLSRRGRPKVSEHSDGRFVVRIDGFIDPVIYAPGMEVTVAGSIDSVKDGRIGDHPYRFLVVIADEHKLWPARRQEPLVYYTTPWYSSPFSWHRPHRIYRPRARHRKHP